MKNLLKRNKIEIDWASVSYTRAAGFRYEARLDLVIDDQVVKFVHRFNDSETYDLISEMSYFDGKKEYIYNAFEQSFDHLIEEYLFEIEQIQE
jgi:hypothetical protein